MIDAMSFHSGLPILGREDELNRARHALGIGGAPGELEGGVLLLSGDAGIGKTSVVTALADEAVATGSWRVLAGHCVGGAGTALPYLPFVEIFARLDHAEPTVVDQLLAGHSALGRLLPRRSQSPANPDLGDALASDRARLLEAVHGALEDLARERPLLLIMEDLHWADESSRDLLTLLFTRSFTGPVSLVATYRSDDLHRRHPLRASLTFWARLPAVARLDLEPLGDGDVADLVRRLSQGLTEPLVEEVVRKAEGNAFFAEELAVAAAHGVSADLLDLSRLLLARVELLDDEAQEVVRVAAVVGRRVPQRLLERVSGLAGQELERHIRLAVEHHVLEPTTSDGYTFRHALLAEAVYEDLLPSERLRLHRACSAALQEDPGLGTAADLARHARAAGETAVAIRASLAAGHGALAIGGPAEALAHYEEGLLLLADGDPAGHELTVGAAEAALRLGRTNRAIALLQSRLDDPTVGGADRAELLGRLSFVLRVTENRIDRDALTTEAVSLLDASTPAQRVYVLTRRIEYLLDAGRPADAAGVAQSAMEAAAADPDSSQVDLVTNLARLTERAGDPLESLKRLEDLVASAAEADIPLVRAMHAIGRVHYDQENLEAALTAYATTAERAEQVGLPWAPYSLDARVMAVTMAYELGRWDLALELADHDDEAAPEFARAALDAAASMVLAARGDDRVTAWYPRIRRFWERDGMQAVQSGAAAVDALGYRGDIDAALATHQEVVAYVRELWEQSTFPGEVRLAALVLGRLAGVATRLSASELDHHLERARELHETALAVFAPDGPRPAPNTDGLAWTARAHAEYLRLLHRAGRQVHAPELTTAWETTVALYEKRGDPYEVSRSLVGLAEALMAVGDHDEASRLLARAKRTAVELRAGSLCDEIEALARRAGGGTVAAPGQGLTPRELDVLRLVAAGRSNGQIGTALFISTKTASVHVSNILAKLGARTRGEAAALARNRGIFG
jgi:DNA-binding CsgD family transcriptional regulator/tetratricopeptide (TPR) repeat protein